MFPLPSETGTEFIEVEHGNSGRWSPSEFDGISESKMTLRPSSKKNHETSTGYFNSYARGRSVSGRWTFEGISVNF